MRHRLALILILAAGSLLACTGGREDWILLQRDLSSTEAASIPFTAKSSGMHQVVLEFSWPITDPQVEKTITSAAATTGASGAPAFDFAWTLLCEGQVVSQRESPQRSTGVVEAATSGLGEGPLKSLGLVFGSFELKAGTGYTLRVLPGPELGAILGVVPRVVVKRKPSMLRGDQ